MKFKLTLLAICIALSLGTLGASTPAEAATSKKQATKGKARPVSKAEKRIEPNSGMGEAVNYLLKRWRRFCRFLEVAGAPPDNNIAERALKMAIRLRNASLFYKTLNGARVGDIYMTLIHTAVLHDENPFHYLTALFAPAVAVSPAAWLPWTYRQTLAGLAVDSSGALSLH